MLYIMQKLWWIIIQAFKNTLEVFGETGWVIQGMKMG